MDHSDEDTNSSFEFVDKIIDSSDTDQKAKEESDDESKWEDVLGSGQLMRKIIKRGGDERPARHDICEVSYECRYNDELIEKVESAEISVSDLELIQGLDLILPLMYVGEESEIKVGPRFAYGLKGCKEEGKEIPPNATLNYTIKMISISPEIEVETMSVEMRREFGLRKKVRGNWWFSREEYTSAIQCYKRAIEYLDYTEKDGDVEQFVGKIEADTLIDERIKVYNNLSAAQLKMDIFDDALHSAEIVLKLQPCNVKALFRKAKALVEKGEKNEAAQCYKKALEIEPQNMKMQVELHKLETLLARDAKNERKLYRKMFEPSKTEKQDPLRTKNAWIKLGVFIGSLAVAVIGVVVYKFQMVD